MSSSERISIGSSSTTRMRQSLHYLLRGGLIRNGRRLLRGHGENEAERAAVARLAVDFELRTVPLHHAVDHREPRPLPRSPLVVKKGLEAAAARRLVHSDARVAHLDVHTRVPSPPTGSTMRVRTVSVPPSASHPLR